MENRIGRIRLNVVKTINYTKDSKLSYVTLAVVEIYGLKPFVRIGFGPIDTAAMVRHRFRQTERAASDETAYSVRQETAVSLAALMSCINFAKRIIVSAKNAGYIHDYFLLLK